MQPFYWVPFFVMSQIYDLQSQYLLHIFRLDYLPAYFVCTCRIKKRTPSKSEMAHLKGLSHKYTREKCELDHYFPVSE